MFAPRELLMIGATPGTDMPFVDDRVSTQLLDAVNYGNMAGVEAALEAGADVNGRPELPYAPMVAAVMTDRVDMIELLLDRGADPETPVPRLVTGPSSENVLAIPGQRALHVAARAGLVDIVHALLTRGRADPNATDSKGRTPLMVVCENDYFCLETVQLLLATGADPTLARNGGLIPLHGAVLKGHEDLVDVLYSSAPATLNCCTSHGITPLYVASSHGKASLVSKLLSLGAEQPVPEDDSSCPLGLAVSRGFVDVVRVLVNEGGIRVIGGEMQVSYALHRAVQARPVKILQMLLGMDGEERRSEWANNSLKGGRLLHYGAASCDPAVVSILLEAGADETARDLGGRTALDAIGLGCGRNGLPEIYPQKEVAVRRMLDRGPAYRARSWAWPSDEDKADAGRSGGGNTTGAAADGAGAGSAVVLSPPPGVKTRPVIDVRIFRPKEISRNKLFVGLVGRYCAKD